MINWKLRLKNKTTLLSICGCAVGFVYQILGAFGVVPSITESSVNEVIGLAITALCGLGIVVDPTTSGVSDSDMALNYEEPRGE